MATQQPRVFVLWLVAALAVATAGAGLAASPAGRKATTHTVVIEGSRFSPSVLNVNAGDNVVWMNKDLFPHTATSRAGGFNSQAIAVGKSWTYVAATKGDFAYTCTFHPVMKGTLRVN